MHPDTLVCTTFVADSHFLESLLTWSNCTVTCRSSVICCRSDHAQNAVEVNYVYFH